MHNIYYSVFKKISQEPGEQNSVDRTVKKRYILQRSRFGSRTKILTILFGNPADGPVSEPAVPL